MATVVGCGTVEVTEPNGTRRVHLHLGPVLLDPPPGGAVSARLSAIGLARTATGTTLGYVAEESTVVSEDCRVVVWAPSTEAAGAVRAALDALVGVCIAVSPTGP
ncbi:MAG: hypothetical protein H6983_17535 [Ectothiorhodospiraceae bacterium]|nr:hypothetical protein [Chromatiales bacterium]MCP5155978.1 hypothetical protein [Ectothiorhodospiraceae bacterium]